MKTYVYSSTLELMDSSIKHELLKLVKPEYVSENPVSMSFSSMADTVEPQPDEAAAVACISNRGTWFGFRPGQRSLPSLRVGYLLPDLSGKNETLTFS